MYFTKEFITQLKQQIPIEHLIGRDVKLEKQANLFVGLCPFHPETQPSFTVFPATQSFYCFGGAGSKTVTQFSDYIAFLQVFHQLSFPQAAVRLAEITRTPLLNDSAKIRDNLSPQTPLPSAPDAKDERPKPAQDPVLPRSPVPAWECIACRFAIGNKSVLNAKKVEFCCFQDVKRRRRHSHAGAWERDQKTSFPCSGVEMRPDSFVSTRRRRNVIGLSRSHAPAWECGWIISFPRSGVGMHRLSLRDR